ncbi:class I SAM-dependent methyltransferase [Paenibacillus solisilvae]|uniref:Class I SAM-dependent methyltransferase n=1 Tax=Paenibacillus solisilvae TaxID=2486751 RepID=A0ABW0W9U1_9BACL
METIADTQVWDRIWSTEPSYLWDALSLSIYEKVCRLTGNLRGKRILEAGSGSGKISLYMAMDGAEMILTDYSESSLFQSRRAFSTQSKKRAFLKEDIRSLSLTGAVKAACTLQASWICKAARSWAGS